MKATALFLSIAPLKRTSSALRRHGALGRLVIGPLVLCFLLAFPSESLAQELSQFKKRFRDNSYIQSSANGITSGAIGTNPASAVWVVEPVAGTNFVRLRNTALGDQYIHTENGPVEVSAVPAGYWTSHWAFEAVANTNYVRIRNRFREDQYLHLEEGPLKSSSVPAGYWTSHWEIIKAAPVVAAATVVVTAREDSLALVALFNATDGPNWTRKRNWLTRPVATWRGVRVSGGRVRGLNLDDAQLSGSLPAELGQLSELESLFLRRNKLTGPIPAELGQLSKLTHLYLNNNQFTGRIPAQLGQLSKLEVLDLRYNKLTGPVPFRPDAFPFLSPNFTTFGGGNSGLCQPQVRRWGGVRVCGK